MTGTWPYPGDSAEARARRVAGAYRAALHDTDPDQCAAIDARMLTWGQRWAVPRAIAYDPDGWLSPAEAADLAGLSPAALRRQRHRLVARRRDKRGYEYLARSVAALSTRPRTRTADQPGDQP